MVKSILTYDAETCRMNEVNTKRITAVEMDAFRRSVGISRKDRVWNDEKRRPMEVDGHIIQEVQIWQLTWYGHEK
jgi:hypothetical protein